MKIKLLVDETIANVMEDGIDKGPKRCVVGEVVDVFKGVADLMVVWGRAEYVVGTKHTEQPNNYQVEEAPKKKSKK